jgi:uncharacterized protein YuzE
MVGQSYDLDADALYITLTDHPVVRTEELDAGTLVDLDAAGQVVGIEVLQPQRAWPLEETLRRFDVPAHEAMELRAYFPQPPKTLMPRAAAASPIPPRTHAQPTHPNHGPRVAVGC